MYKTRGGEEATELGNGGVDMINNAAIYLFGLTHEMAEVITFLNQREASLFPGGQSLLSSWPREAKEQWKMYRPWRIRTQSGLKENLRREPLAKASLVLCTTSLSLKVKVVAMLL